MSSKTIGIAICAYKGHIPHLKRLFNSIEAQTRKPDQVVVSCSSSLPEDIPYRPNMYSFPFTIITTEEKKMASQNRNIAASHITTDIITFFDADDEMHPQRLEIIEDCFTKHNVKILMHNYELETSNPFETINEFIFHINYLDKDHIWGATILRHPYSHCPLTNGHVTVSRDAWQNIKFNELPEYHSKDDTIFCTDVIMAYPLQTAYCFSKLSKYYPSRSVV